MAKDNKKTDTKKENKAKLENVKPAKIKAPFTIVLGPTQVIESANLKIADDTEMTKDDVTKLIEALMTSGKVHYKELPLFSFDLDNSKVFIQEKTQKKG